MQITIHDDGINLDADLVMPKCREGKVPLCIIIHGFTGCKDERHLTAIADRMNELGMATLRVDMYGHGKSGGTFRNHTLYKWFSNAITVIDYVKTLPEISRIYLCGHSQGGLTVIMAGSMKEDEICGIIPLSPAVMIPDQAREGNILGTEFDPKKIPDVFVSKDGWTLSSNYARVAQTIYPDKAISKYKGPVLIVQGEDDKTVPADVVRKAAEAYANCTYTGIPGETHCYDNHLDLVVEAVGNFITENRWNA